MTIYARYFLVMRTCLDILGILICFLLTCYYHDMLYVYKVNNIIWPYLILIWLYSSYRTSLYDDFGVRRISGELFILVKNIVVQIAAIIVLNYFITSLNIRVTFLIEFALLLLIFLVSEKLLVSVFIRFLRIKGVYHRNLIVIGAGFIGRNFIKFINKNPQFGYKFLGFIDDNIPSGSGDKILGASSVLKTMLEENRVDEIIIALPQNEVDKIDEIIDICENYTTRIKIIPDYFRFISGNYHMSQFGQIPLISVRNYKFDDLNARLLKRIFDIILTLLIFIFVLSWLMPLIMLAIKLDSKGSIFFNAERWGKSNKKINMYKFRSMYENTKTLDENGKHLQARKNDPRITRLGRILRASNLDELPQFINVLKGDMSIVGPRPHSTPLNIESKDSVKRYLLRHLAKPGITGWAQINGLRGETPEIIQMQRRVDHDIWYMENWTILLDFKIVALTVIRMFKGDQQAY
jgi:putative colanic acid biosysnthesis UDP-glucose lipid carrier transferase